MKHRHIKALDDVAHFLYCPTMLGSRAARARWHHRIHLVPGFLLAVVCDAYERSLGTYEDWPLDTRAISCPDGCTRFEVGNGVLTGGVGVCGERMRPATFTGVAR